MDSDLSKNKSSIMDTLLLNDHYIPVR